MELNFNRIFLDNHHQNNPPIKWKQLINWCIFPCVPARFTGVIMERVNHSTSHQINSIAALLWHLYVTQTNGLRVFWGMQSEKKTNKTNERMTWCFYLCAVSFKEDERNQTGTSSTSRIIFSVVDRFHPRSGYIVLVSHRSLYLSLVFLRHHQHHPEPDETAVQRSYAL